MTLPADTPNYGTVPGDGWAAPETPGEHHLPGSPGPLLWAVWGALTTQERDALYPHLMGTTSAEWLSQTLRDCGITLSATSIRTYRRSLRERAAQSPAG